MNTRILLTLSTILSLHLVSPMASAQIMWDFTGPDFSNGGIAGQQGFNSYGGAGTVDVSGGGSFTADNGATVWRQQSDGDIGETFSDTSTILEYTFTFTTGAAGTPGFTPNFQFQLGSNAGGADVALFVRQDTALTYTTSGGSSSTGAIFNPSASNTLVAIVDYGTSTYSVLVNGSNTVTDATFRAGSNRDNQFFVRDSGYTGIEITSIGVAAIPEPSSIALMGLGLAGLAFRRRR